MTVSRRQFLHYFGSLGAGAVGGGIGAAAPMGISLATEIETDYRALVCLFLNGGNDAFHQLVPMDDASYRRYATPRQSIAMHRQDLLEIPMHDANGTKFGLHPAMKALQPMFQTGDAAAVLNVGPLIEPVDKAKIANGSATLPPFLFAHNKQLEVWQKSWMNGAYSENGWLGMSMDVLANDLGGLPNSFFTSPTKVLDSFESERMFVSQGGFAQLQALTGKATRSSYTAIANSHYDSPLAEGYARAVRLAISAQQAMEPVVERFPLDPLIPRSGLGDQLRVVKQMIDAAPLLGHKRLVFFVSQGGFDTHDNQSERQHSLMAEFSEAVAGLYRSLGKAGLSDKVMTFTMSEFGRTIHDNARKGTDHGWGGGQYVFGGNTNAHRCFGNYPDFSQGSRDDNGEGRLIPAIAHEQYAAYMVKWLGLNDNALNQIFPTLERLGGVMR